MEPMFVQGKEYGEIIEMACPLVQGTLARVCGELVLQHLHRHLGLIPGQRTRHQMNGMRGFGSQ